MKGKYYFARCDRCKKHRRVLVVDDLEKKTKTFKFDGCGHERVDVLIEPTVSFVKELSDLYDKYVTENNDGERSNS